MLSRNQQFRFDTKAWRQHSSQWTQFVQVLHCFAKKLGKNQHETMKRKQKEVKIHNIFMKHWKFFSLQHHCYFSKILAKRTAVKSHKLEWNLISSISALKILFPFQFCIAIRRCYFCHVRMKQNASKSTTETLPKLPKFNESWSFFWSNSSL